MFAIGLGVIMATLNVSIINVSLPTLVKALRTDFATIQWVILSFLLCVTGLMLTVARLGDMIGKKEVYVTGLALFTVGSLLCGFSSTVGWLIGFRVVQGIGGVMMQALGAAIITEIFPASERGMALGVIGGTVAVGLALGPGIGGLMIGLAGWRSVFWLNVPLGLIAWLAVRRHIPASPPGRSGRGFDLIGAAILQTTLLVYALAMTLGQNWGFDHRVILGLLTVSGFGLVVFVSVEARAPQPMIELDLFRNVLFGINLLMGLLVFIVMGGFFVIPFYLELVKGYPPERVGLLMMVVPAIMGLVSMKAGSLSDRYGPRWISLLGLVILAGGCLTTSTLDAEVGPLGYILRLAPIGIGFGMFQAPNSSAIMGASPSEHLGLASGLLALSRNLGQTTGLPLFGALFSGLVVSGGPLTAKTKVAAASPEALVHGLAGTYRLAALFVLAPTLLTALAWWIDQRRAGRHGTDQE